MTRTASGHLPLPPTLDLGELLSYWGRDPASVSERVDGETITWALRLRQWPCVLSARLEAPGHPGSAAGSEQGTAHARFRVLEPTGQNAETIGATPRPGLDEALDLLRRLLGLHLDPAPFVRGVLAGRPGDRADPLAPHVARRPGLTIPQTPTVFDGVVWVIAGQQVSLPVAFAIRRRLALALGRRLNRDDLAPDDLAREDRPGIDDPERPLVIQPSAAEICATDVDFLRQQSLSLRKAEYLHGIAERTLDGRLDLEGLCHRPAEEVIETLLALRGLGPWSVHYLRMRSLGHADCVPVGDVALNRAVGRLHRLTTRPKSQAAADLLDPYAPYRSLATFHAWASLRDELEGGELKDERLAPKNRGGGRIQ